MSKTFLNEERVAGREADARRTRLGHDAQAQRELRGVGLQHLLGGQRAGVHEAAIDARVVRLHGARREQRSYILGALREREPRGFGNAHPLNGVARRPRVSRAQRTHHRQWRVLLQLDAVARVDSNGDRFCKSNVTAESVQTYSYIICAPYRYTVL